MSDGNGFHPKARLHFEAVHLSNLCGCEAAKVQYLEAERPGRRSWALTPTMSVRVSSALSLKQHRTLPTACDTLWRTKCRGAMRRPKDTHEWPTSPPPAMSSPESAAAMWETRIPTTADRSNTVVFLMFEHDALVRRFNLSVTKVPGMTLYLR